MKRLAALVGLVAVGSLTLAAAARQPPAAGQPPAPQTAEIEKVKDNLYMIRNGGGNTGVFITASGVVVVDTKNPGWGQRILEKIKSVTDKPVTMIINTHTHGDHTGSNNDFPATVDIVAHENTKTYMEKMTGGRGPTFTGDNAKFLPKRTFRDRMSLLGGKDQIDLYYFGPGHTGGDALVVFKGLRAMHAGDLFASKGAPIMDVNNGGSGVGYPKTLAAATAGIKNVDTIITGHSTVMTWNDLKEFGEFVTAFVTAVQDAQKAGKTEEAAAAELKLPDRFKDYNMGRARADVGVIYAELKK